MVVQGRSSDPTGDRAAFCITSVPPREKAELRMSRASGSVSFAPSATPLAPSPTMFVRGNVASAAIGSGAEVDATAISIIEAKHTGKIVAEILEDTAKGHARK